MHWYIEQFWLIGLRLRSSSTVTFGRSKPPTCFLQNARGASFQAMKAALAVSRHMTHLRTPRSLFHANACTRSNVDQTENGSGCVDTKRTGSASRHKLLTLIGRGTAACVARVWQLRARQRGLCGGAERRSKNRRIAGNCTRLTLLSTVCWPEFNPLWPLSRPN